MDILKKYTIPYKSLGVGKHHFDFEVDNALFKAFENTEIKNGTATVTVDVVKSASMAELTVAIRGTVTVECDRCLDDLSLPVDYKGSITVKTSETPIDFDGDIMWLNPGEDDIPLAQYIYESIVLSLPYQKVHGSDSAGNPLCNPEMLARFSIVTQEEFDRMTVREESLGNNPETAKLQALKKKLEKSDKL